jgi:hypothetical protein
MSSFPPGTFQYLRDMGAFRPVKWCQRCNRMVSRWHEHLTEPGKPIFIIPEVRAHE